MAKAKGKDEIKTSDVTAKDLGVDQVQAAMDEETGQGFRGKKVDPTPNEHYTVAGVTKGLPTPENDPEQAQKVGSSRFNHVEMEKK
jgi:hypothetical protein